MCGLGQELCLARNIGLGWKWQAVWLKFRYCFFHFFSSTISVRTHVEHSFSTLDLRILYFQKKFYSTGQRQKRLQKIAGIALERGSESVKAFGGVSLVILLLKTFFCLYNMWRSRVEKLCSTCVLTAFAGKKNCKKQQWNLSWCNYSNYSDRETTKFKPSQIQFDKLLFLIFAPDQCIS